MQMEEKKISGEVIYDGKVVKLEKDKVLCPNGTESYREIVRHNGGSAILCINENNEILMIKQFRYAYNEVMYEIPAGKLEKGEDPKDAAIRELEEETAMKANDIQFLGKIYPSCGYTSEKIYLYLVKNYHQTKTSFDDDEYIITQYIPLEKVKEMILNGSIKDAKTICAISYYLLNENKL